MVRGAGGAAAPAAVVCGAGRTGCSGAMVLPAPARPAGCPPVTSTTLTPPAAAAAPPGAAAPRGAAAAARWPGLVGPLQAQPPRGGFEGVALIGLIAVG